MSVLNYNGNAVERSYFFFAVFRAAFFAAGFLAAFLATFLPAAFLATFFTAFLAVFLTAAFRGAVRRNRPFFPTNGRWPRFRFRGATA